MKENIQATGQDDANLVYFSRAAKEKPQKTFVYFRVYFDDAEFEVQVQLASVKLAI